MSGAPLKTDYRVPSDSAWAGAWKVPAALAVVGAVLLLLGLGSPGRMGYSYLFGFFTGLTFVLGAIFLVVIQFLTVGHWGITTRRIAEVVMSAAPLMLVLSLPFFVGVATGKFTMYDEWIGLGHGDDHGAVHQPEHSSTSLLGASVAHAEAPKGHGEAGEAEEHAHTPQEQHLHHATLAKKATWLNKPRWLAFGLGYLVIWCLIALAYFRWSRLQDESKDPAHTRQMQSLSAVSLLMWAAALTFAAFDWLMALEPTWFSTIFGVVIFASSAVAILALVSLIAMSLYKAGHVGDAINLEHFHDLGKLLFGFICFWTYVQFSQWMLIWYAGLPEEAIWFHKRWEGGWKAISLLLIFGHFVFPFVLLISRIQKRALRWFQFMCIWILAMHVVDMYWFILPQAGALSFSLVDAGGLLFVVGTLLAYVLWKLTKVPLLPVGDPRLARCLHHHQSH